jgi:hypothetical protein
MDVESQKFMALEGLHSWARGVISHVKAMEAARGSMFSLDNDRRTEASRSFQRERHLFLTAAHKMLEHINWISKLSFIDSSVFAELKALENDIKELRDMNEHVIEYFLGRGKRPENWVYESDGGIADASSTIDSKIGGRLDWNQVASAAERLIRVLPPHYYPSRTRP